MSAKAARTPTIDPPHLSDSVSRVLRELWKDDYTYKTKAQNALHPVCVAEGFPGLLEKQDFAWASRFLPGSLKAWSNYLLKHALFLAQRAAYSFDGLRAHSQLFYCEPPEFARTYDSDEAFAYRRIAGPNAVSIRCVDDLDELKKRIPLREPRLRALEKELKTDIDLHAATREGRLFEVDYCLLVEAMRPGALPKHAQALRKKLRRTADRKLTRDSRWRQKYLPAPIGVFLEHRDPARRTNLWPVAIQIDQPQPGGEHNPVYYFGDGPGWKLAKLYFEVADQNTHFGSGHVGRTHFVMEPFCMATARQLAFDHPVHLLLQPHTRYTLATNAAAYKDFVNSKEIYFKFYAGTLEESRQILIESSGHFVDLDLKAELRGRGMFDHLEEYPYRDDSLLWRDPIQKFVSTYVRAFYGSNRDVRSDASLQAWAAELMSADGGNVRSLVPRDRLDTLEKLVDLLAQILFIAGPGHAAQHYSEMYYCRFAPAFPPAAYAPPPWKADRATEARFVNTLPPISPASLQFTFSEFGNFRFDRFGDYSAYPLSRVREAAAAIGALRDDLQRIEDTITRRIGSRLLPYDFLLPSNVPNSINI